MGVNFTLPIKSRAISCATMEKQWSVAKMWVVAKWMVSDWHRSGLSSFGRNSPSSFCVPSVTVQSSTDTRDVEGGGGTLTLVPISRDYNQSRCPITDMIKPF